MEVLSDTTCFSGHQLRCRHHAQSLSADMHFSLFLPPQAEHGVVPVVFWLSGLTCTDENFVQKAGAQRAAAEHGVALLAPDTSPRGEGVPDDPEGAYDFGLGAGFYVNATVAPFAQHYQMYTYITQELPRLVQAEFPIDGQRQSISGHSMGGHGALTIALKNPNLFRAASAFAPICAPIQCPWGQKALTGYLGPDQSNWRTYDTCALIDDGAPLPPLLIDQGEADDFLDEQLQPAKLDASLAARGRDCRVNMHPGYDHSYFFIASFIDKHIAFHSEILNA